MNSPSTLDSSVPSRDDTESEQVLLKKAIANLTTGDFNQQWQAAKSLKRMGNEAHRHLLPLTQDSHADPDLLCFISEILGANSTSESILALVDLLKRTTSEEVQNTIVLTLAKQGPDLIDELLSYAHQPSLQKSVLKALIQINHPKTIPGLILFSEYEDANLRSNAFEALGNFHTPLITEKLAQGLHDLEPIVRGCCAKALGLRSEQEISEAIVQALIPLLNDSDPKVRSLTARALGRMKRDDAIEGLWKTLITQPEPTLLCKDLMQALGWARQPKGIDHLLALLDSTIESRNSTCSPAFEWTTGLVVELVQILGNINETSFSPQIAGALTPLLGSASFPYDQMELKLRLITAIAYLKQEHSIAPLIQSLSIPEARLRFHIIAALKGINPEESHTQLLAQSQDSTLEAGLAEGIDIALREW